MALLSVNSSFGLRVLTERDGNLAEMPRYARLQEKHSFGFILRQHVHLAVSPSPPPPPPALPITCASSGARSLRALARRDSHSCNSAARFPLGPTRDPAAKPERLLPVGPPGHGCCPAPKAAQAVGSLRFGLAPPPRSLPPRSASWPPSASPHAGRAEGPQEPPAGAGRARRQRKMPGG